MADNPYAKYANPYAGYVPVGIPDPTKPLDITGKQLGNQKTAFELQQLRNQATADTRIKNAQAIQEEQKASDAAFAGGDALGDPNLTGAARFASIPKDKQPLVRLMLNNQLQQLGSFSFGKPAIQSLIATAAAVDPHFDPSVFGIRYGAMRDFAGGGKNATAVAAADRLALNLKQLKDISDKMGGPNLGFRPLNAAFASGKESFEPKLSASYDALLPEIANQFDLIMKSGKGTPTVSGVGEVMNGLKRTQSQDERDAAMEQVVKAVRGAIEPIKAQWQSAYGGNTAPPMWISPEAAQFYAKIDPEHAGSYNPNDQHGIPGLHGNPGETSPPGSGFTPPPTGQTGGGIGPSTNGFNDIPDPQSADFWTNAARQGTSYRDALNQWRSDVRVRGLVGITPPPPGAYHKAASYIRDHPTVPYQPFNSVERKPINPLQQAATDAAFSGPGVGIGHTANSVAANIPTLLAGDQGARYNAVSNAMHPNYAIAGDLAGTVLGALGTGKALGTVAPNLGRVGQFIAGTPGRTAFTGDVLFGGASGAAQNPDNPFLGAAEGAGGMAAGNVAGRFILGPAIRGGARLVNKTAGMFGAAPIDIPQPLSGGQNMIYRGSKAGLDDITTNLQDASNLGLPYSLADADPRLRLLAGSAARKSPDIRAMAENVFGPRQLGQGERAISQINTNLAPVGDVPTIKADALTRARAASAPLYSKALSHPAPDDPALTEMLDTPAGQQAARNAYGIALNSGENPAELSFATGADGQPVISAQPNWKTLQYIKMGLDKVITDNQNPVTGKLDLSDPANRALNDLRGRFVSRLGELNPDYKAANSAYQGLVSQGTAAERGAAATGAKVTPEQAQIAVTNAGQNLPFFQRGYASDMADQVERSKLSGNPYNMIYGSMGQRAKVASIFPQGAQAFDRANALEGDMSKTGTELFGGSQTQPRAEADKMFSNPIADNATDLAFGLATGVPPPSLIKRGLGTFARDNLRLGMGARQKADQIGPILLNTDPSASLQTLNDLQRLAAMRQAYVNQSRTYGGMFGAPLLSAPILYGSNQN